MKTKLYRVLLLAANAAAGLLLLVDKFGPGIGLTPNYIGLIDAGLNVLIVLGRQISDPTTPTLPAKPAVLP